jgi:hypothetical protein
VTAEIVPTNLVDVQAVDSGRIPWEELLVEQTGALIPIKPLFSDPDTGMSVQILRYAAGFTNTWHCHTHGHGMYVLDGVLSTHQGEFGPGSWVWFPEGGWMHHGATEVSDVTFMFITNKPFEICYTFEDDPPAPLD